MDLQHLFKGYVYRVCTSHKGNIKVKEGRLITVLYPAASLAGLREGTAWGHKEASSWQPPATRPPRPLCLGGPAGPCSSSGQLQYLHCSLSTACPAPVPYFLSMPTSIFSLKALVYLSPQPQPKPSLSETWSILSPLFFVLLPLCVLGVEQA